MILIGVTQHSPWRLHELLHAIGLKDYLADVGQPLDLQKIKACDVVMLPTFSLLTTNIKMLNSKTLRGKPVLLFASVLRLCEVEGCYPLDYKPRDGLRYKFHSFDKSTLKRLLKSDDVEAVLTQKKLIPQLVENVQHGSFLSPLMTLLYRLPASQQTSLRTSLLQWMISTDDLAKLREILSRSRIPDEIRLALYNHIKSDLSTRYRAALAAIRKSPKVAGADYTALAAEHSTIKYELRYILKSLKQDDMYREMDGVRLDALWQRRYSPK